MAPIVIEWDGNQVPEELRKLPPGRYAIESIDELPRLTEAEQTGVLDGLNELDAGKGIPLADVVREIRGSTPAR